jgi:hypothetical protein
MSSALLSIPDAAAHLWIGKTLFRREVLPHLAVIAIGCRRLVRRVDVEAWAGTLARGNTLPARSRSGRPAGSWKLRLPRGRTIYSVYFSHAGRQIERTTGERDKDAASKVRAEIWGRIVLGHKAPPRVADDRVDSKRAGVYFIRQGGHVKIGTSGNVAERLRHGQTFAAEPFELLAVVDGGPREERAFHVRFRHLRGRGEWYRFDGSLKSYVRELRGDDPGCAA